jgi:hypothetical protein
MLFDQATRRQVMAVALLALFTLTKQNSGQRTDKNRYQTVLLPLVMNNLGSKKDYREKGGFFC